MTGRPIFVVGFRRSGTTLLQSLLGAHPHIAAAPEMHFYFRIHDLRDHWGDLRDDDRAAATLHALLHAPAGLLDRGGFDETRLLGRFRRTDRSYRALLATVLDDFAERHGKRRWSEKTPNQLPAQVWSLFPDAQVVHVRRDPRAVVASAARLGREPAWATARDWVRFTRATLDQGAAAGADRFLTVGYEDLAAGPEPTLRQVMEFLGEPFDPATIDDPEGRRTPVSAPWQAEASTPVRPPRSEWSRLPAARRALVSRELQGALPALGYPPVDERLAGAGRLLAPARWPHLVRLARVRRRAARARTPAERYAAVQAFVTEELRGWSSGGTP